MVKLYDLLDSIPPSVNVDIHYYKENKFNTEKKQVFIGSVGDIMTSPKFEEYKQCYSVVRPTIVYSGVNGYPNEWLLITILYNESE